MNKDPIGFKIFKNQFDKMFNKKPIELGYVRCLFCEEKKPITNCYKIGVKQICDECFIKLKDLIKFIGG